MCIGDQPAYNVSLTYLIVAFTRGAVRYVLSAGFDGHVDQGLGNARPGEGRAQHVTIFVNGVGLNTYEDENVNDG